MTDREKIELIKRATEILDDDLTIEEHEFLYGRSWDDVPEEEKQLWYTAWREKPTTIEHAAYNTGCTPAEVAIAAKVVRAIRENWLDAGAARPKEFDIETPAGDLLALLERAAVDLRPYPIGTPLDVQIKPCPFCGAEAHIIWNARRTALTGTGRQEVTGALVCCTNCPAQLFTAAKELVRDMWNTRKGEG